MSSSSDDIGRAVSRRIVHTYFTTQEYPYTRHHIDSYDQFMSTDLRSILRTSNPILILKDLLPNSNTYAYKVEIFVGGKDADKLRIGTPVVSLEKGEDVRLLFPNEARLRNLTYAADVVADIEVRLTFSERAADGQIISGEPVEITIPNVNLFRIPIMLHSRYCLLHGKPKDFLRQAGECPYDQGGYFIVDGSEKVLISKQEQAFNTLYISKKNNDPKLITFASVTSLSPETRAVKYVAFGHMRKSEVLNISLPYVRKPINVFILFRAMGVQSDEAIMNLIFPDRASADYQFLADKLVPTIVDAHPFLNSYSCIQYIKTLTKGFSEVHVLDIIKNQLFIHVPDTPGARLNYLADCVRSILRVSYDFDKSTDRDDVRNQRCLTSGFSIQMLFNGIYAKWRKAVSLSVDKEWEYNKRIYSGEAFVNIFDPGNKVRIFNEGYMSDSIMRAFKGKWGSGMGEEKAGLLQQLSRLSYLDFLSHCRRVVLEFDTGMKLPGPRHLHTSQFGYFCTNETPGGASIGITKNLSILTFISTGVNPAPLVEWLRRRGGVASCNSVTADQKQVFIPVTINNGIIGYTRTATELLTVLRAMKHTGWLPCTVGVGFSYTGRRLFINTDEGRPLRPLIVNRRGMPVKAIAAAESWRDLIMGTHPRRQVPLSNSEFADPLADKADVTFEDYMAELTPHLSVLEYIDPYEHNETYIATFPEHINSETTHIEVHPSTMMGLMTGMIPYANHNQSPRNQLSCSQSKQGLSIYATNWQNRYDNNGHILCYGEAPLIRTMYYDYAAEGRIGYGHNVIMALAPFEGYNQEDGIVFNRDSFQRGLFRSVAYRSYEFFEEDDEMSGAKTRIGNPMNIPGWTDLRPGLDYKHLDDRGIIRVGQYVDEDTVICGGYMMLEKGKYKDASLTPQVWTRGIVESVVVTVNNMGLRLVKIRVSQDRTPELGDKFSNRHGQKGTIGMMFPAVDMPRTASGVVPDVIVNPHSIPSRMTIAQVLEQIFGKMAAMHGAIGDATSFMNEGSPADAIGNVLEEQYGMERYGNEILYDGKTGAQIPTEIFIAPVYYMRLKHMVEDKWQARTTGRKELRTHQPTGGRGKEGGLRIGEMDRDAIITHGIAGFVRESIMKRSDGTTFPVCTGCGTIPIYNERLEIAVCPMCQGPLKFAGNTVDTLEMIPPLTKPVAPIVNIEIPYATKLLDQELTMFMNAGFRYQTTGGGLQHLNVKASSEATAPVELTDRVIQETEMPEYEVRPSEVQKAAEDQSSLQNLSAVAKKLGMTLVPMEAAMRLSTIKEEATPATLVTPATAAEGDLDDLEVTSGLPVPGLAESQVLGPAVPLTVLGSKAPQQAPAQVVQTAVMAPTTVMSPSVMAPTNQIVPGMPVMTQQAVVNAAAGPTVIVDTSPRALQSEGIILEDVGAGGMNAGLRLASRRPSRRVGFAEEGSAAPTAAPAPAQPTGTITVNKLG
jgi:DNA-directed RNA polymerase II subunit RPB2